jgi:hypothetical protein
MSASESSQVENVESTVVGDDERVDVILGRAGGMIAIVDDVVKCRRRARARVMGEATADMEEIAVVYGCP